MIALEPGWQAPIPGEKPMHSGGRFALARIVTRIPTRNGTPSGRAAGYLMQWRCVPSVSPWKCNKQNISIFRLSRPALSSVKISGRNLKWRRTIRRNGNGKALDLSGVHYTVDDIAKLDQSGKERRRTAARDSDFHALSQTLRTVGVRRSPGIRLLELSSRGANLTLRLEQPGGRSLVETHTTASLHNNFVGMIFDRQKKKFVGNEDAHIGCTDEIQSLY